MSADLLVITDEVYEHLVFDGHRHIPLAGLDGMAERTITISSAAKMFNCTGWKIGWACGPAELIHGVRAAKQYLSYVGGAPFQPAVADALNTEDAWVAALRNSLQDRRDRLARGLTEIGFEVHDSAGTYFLCADPRPLGYDDSTAFCAALPEQVGVAAIPMTRILRSRPPRTGPRGITWCASPSASATTRSTKRSGDSGGCGTDRLHRPVRGKHSHDFSSQSLGRGVEDLFACPIDQELGYRRRGLEGDLESHPRPVLGFALHRVLARAARVAAKSCAASHTTQSGPQWYSSTSVSTMPETRMVTFT